MDHGDKDFEGIMEGLGDALAIVEGRADPADYRVHIPVSVDVKAIRKSLKLTQDEFALRYGFSLGRLRDWEQGRSEPDASNRILLTVLASVPDVVHRVLEAANNNMPTEVRELAEA